MATKKTAPKKASKPVKKAASTKKVSAPKKAVSPKAAVKKSVKQVSSSKKAAPVKKTAPAKKSQVKAAPTKKAPAKAAPAKKAPVKAVPAKKAPAKALPVKKATSAKKSPVKAAPAKKAPTKNAPMKKQVVAKKSVPAKKVAVKPVPVKKAAPAKNIKPAPKPQANNKQKALASKTAPSKNAPAASKPAGKKVPVIAPEIRFAQTSKAPASATEIRKALRAKETKKDLKPIPMPKITAKTARKYEPEFTKSVLDAKTVVEHTGPTQRYSDAELQEFRELIQNKLNAAKQELAYLNGLITRKDSMSGEDNDSRYMTMEDGSLSMEREQLSQMASRQIDFIEKLEKAMMRIENKTYGICRITGKLIDKARLRAVPHATLSMEAKMNMNKPGGGN